MDSVTLSEHIFIFVMWMIIIGPLIIIALTSGRRHRPYKLSRKEKKLYRKHGYTKEQIRQQEEHGFIKDGHHVQFGKLSPLAKDFIPSHRSWSEGKKKRLKL